MDGTIANWGKEWDFHATRYQHLGLVLTPNQKSFNLYEGLSDEGKKAVTSIMEHPGFYANLDPFPGAREALNSMVEEGHIVSLVTSPWVTNITCASDKLAWVERYLGLGWAKRTIITSDKTLVRGDILIDDKPDITGDYAPTWEHVYFSQPYNIDSAPERRRISSWETDEWRGLL